MPILLSLKLPQIVPSTVTGTIEIKPKTGSRGLKVSPNVINFHQRIYEAQGEGGSYTASEGYVDYDIPQELDGLDNFEFQRFENAFDLYYMDLVSSSNPFEPPTNEPPSFLISFPQNEYVAQPNLLTVTLSSLKIHFDNESDFDPSLYTEDFEYLKFINQNIIQPQF